MLPIRFLVALSVSLLGASLASVVLPRRAAAQQAVPESRIESVRGTALGSGMRASSAGTHALADNPANLVRGGLYHLETFALYNPTYKQTSLGGAVTDSMTSKLAAGFSMRGLFGSNDAGRHKGYDGRLGLAYPLVEMLSVGLALRYADIRVPNPDGPDEDPDENVVDQRYRLKHFTMDAAVSLSAGSLTLSALGSNLVETKSVLAPRTVGGSASYGVNEAFMLGGDVLVDLDGFADPKIIAGGGLEYFVGGTFPLRAGYRYDQGRKSHAITAGVAYVDKIIGVHASLRQSIADQSETFLVFAFQYFVK